MEARISAAGGCLLILASGLMLLFLFGMSTLSGGEFPDGTSQWWSAVLGTMFGSPNGTYTYACIAAVAFGLYLCIRPSGTRMTVRRLISWVAGIAVVLGVLVWSASKEYVIMLSRETRPDGSVVETVQYANFFGPTRKVEAVRK